MKTRGKNKSWYVSWSNRKIQEISNEGVRYRTTRFRLHRLECLTRRQTFKICFYSEAISCHPSILIDSVQYCASDLNKGKWVCLSENWKRWWVNWSKIQCWMMRIKYFAAPQENANLILVGTLRRRLTKLNNLWISKCAFVSYCAWVCWTCEHRLYLRLRLWLLLLRTCTCKPVLAINNV